MEVDDGTLLSLKNRGCIPDKKLNRTTTRKALVLVQLLLNNRKKERKKERNEILVGVRDVFPFLVL